METRPISTYTDILGGVTGMSETIKSLQDQFKHLRLSVTAAELPTILRKAEQASWTYRKFIQEIVRYQLSNVKKKYRKANEMGEVPLH